ncbi:alpha/beta hydrolase [Anaerocolumna sp. AGMB13020]|uniref:alpha/beta hydrolase n=1 Tax=Anaerocolumna sp. AGMB13020 TaxID=3081750 RepID=UPI002952CE55|nr:alpha/beta hydrolase [Anaerocolumna sp. AGMB13020]WOO36922.1 alpha/beta hydrolase [Anaerocolumna sp. AGMB13020]
MKKKKIIIRILIILAAILFILAGAFLIYVLKYYKADATAQDVYSTYSESIEVGKDYTVFYPEPNKNKNTGLIFYPGGKVEETAYAPIMNKLSSEGITCVLIKMPFRLAVFDVNAADGIMEKFPEITSWYMGGHSLGGAMASSYAVEHSKEVTGLILLAAYPVSKSDIPAVIIYGSEDKVLNRDKLKGLTGLVEIQGGNHAQFGNYGFQKGDGTASISSEEQQMETVKAIVEFISKKP